MSGRTVPREGLGNLARDPLRCRMVGDAQRDHPSPLVLQDDQDEQQPKVDRRDHKEVLAPIPAIWSRKNVFHVWPERGRRLAMYLATVDCANSIPSFNSSPCIRGAPHSEFSMLIRRIKLRTSAEALGPPPWEREFHRQ
jgi:hypothetical protein